MTSGISVGVVHLILEFRDNLITICFFVAENEDDYFKKAIEAQSKTKLLNELKLTLRNNFSKSDVFNSKKFTIDFSNLLKTLL